MTRFLDRLASLPLFMLGSTACSAGLVYVPCEDYAVPVAPVAHIAAHTHLKAHPHKHHHRTHKRVAGVGGRRGLHLAIARGMCPIYTMDEELGGPEGSGSFGGGWFEETAETALGAVSGDSDMGLAGGGYVVGVWAVGEFEESSQLAVYQTNTTTQVVETITNIITSRTVVETSGSTATAAPEPSTYAMMLAGFAALMFFRWRRA